MTEGHRYCLECLELLGHEADSPPTDRTAMTSTPRPPIGFDERFAAESPLTAAIADGRTPPEVAAHHDRPLVVRISGVAMSTIEGSSLHQEPDKYVLQSDPDYPAALRAGSALQSAYGRRAGKGWTYTVELDADAARILEDYCRTVGETFAGESEADIRAEGRALLVVADRIVRQLEA